MSQGKLAEAVEHDNRSLDAGYAIADLHRMKAIANRYLDNFRTVIAECTIAIEVLSDIRSKNVF